MIRAVIYIAILIIALLGTATEYFGLVMTILLFGIVNVLTLSVYETYNSYIVNNSYISSNFASRIMQTVLQSGAFLGAIISGTLLNTIGYENIIKFISIYEITLNILFYLFNQSINNLQRNFTTDHSTLIHDKASISREIKLIYILCLPLGMIGISYIIL